MLVHKSFRLNSFIFMYNVIEIIDFHEDVNINTLFNNVIKKNIANDSARSENEKEITVN